MTSTVIATTIYITAPITICAYNIVNLSLALHRYYPGGVTPYPSIETDYAFIIQKRQNSEELHKNYFILGFYLAVELS